MHPDVGTANYWNMASHSDQRCFIFCSWHQTSWGEPRSLCPMHKISLTVKQHDLGWEFFIPYFKILNQHWSELPNDLARQLISLQTNTWSFEVHISLTNTIHSPLQQKLYTGLSLSNKISHNSETIFPPDSFPWCSWWHLLYSQDPLKKKKRNNGCT